MTADVVHRVEVALASGPWTFEDLRQRLPGVETTDLAQALLRAEAQGAVQSRLDQYRDSYGGAYHSVRVYEVAGIQRK
jgi:hypothetical protein